MALLVGVAGLVCLGFIAFLSWSYPVLLPLGLAVIIALVLEPAVNFLQHRGINRRSATLATCLGAVVVFLLFWIFLLPPLVTDSTKFLTSLPALVNEGFDKLDKFGAEPEPAPVPSPPAAAVPVSTPPATPGATNLVATNAAPPVPVETSTRKRGQKEPPPRRIIYHAELRDWVKNNLPVLQQEIQTNLAHLVYTAVGPVGQALGFLLGFGFVPIYVYYFLADQKDIEGHWHEYVPLRRSPLRNEVILVLNEINLIL